MDETDAASPSRPDPKAVNALFAELLDLDSAARGRALEEFSGDPQVLAQAKRLLELSDDLPARLDRPRVGLEEPGSARVPSSIGPYAVEGLIGSGGMGIVYRGRQANPPRPVAIKLMRRLGGSAEAARRFSREARFLGRLQHPSIAQVLESGVAEVEGEETAYIAMELIDGVPVNRFVRAERPGLEHVVRLLADLCEAIHHAHLRGVVHRDLKPANVLVTEDGQLKVIDFGIARALDDRETLTLETHAGQILGTLAYMSPEQVRGDAAEVDARADVYALGIIAYELLGGRLPLDLESGSVAQAARMVEEVEPPRLGQVAPRCRGDLEWIVARAMEKDPDRRYASAIGLAQDLRRFLAREPVEARPPSLVYQVSRLARRHRGLFAGAAVALVAVVAGGAVALTQAIESRRLADLELDARREAERLAALESEARLEAEGRSELLERITILQANLLRTMQPTDLARVVRRELVTDLDAALERSGLDPTSRLEAADELLDRLATADLEGALATGLDEAFFALAASQVAEELEGEPVDQARLLRSLGDAELRTELYDSAIASYERARALLLEAHGGESPESLLALLDIALAQMESNRFPEAIALLDEHAAELEEQLAPHREFGRYLRQRAIEARLRGDLSTAIDLYRRAVEGASFPPAVHRPDLRSQVTVDFDTLSTRTDLGLVLAQSGEVEEGLAILSGVIEELESFGPVETLHPQLRESYLWVSIDLGVVTWRSGNPEEGERILVEALELNLAYLGADDSNVARARAELGRLYAESGRCDAALPLLEDAFRILVRVGGTLSPSLFDPLAMLARCTLSQGDLEGSLEWAERLRTVTEASFVDQPQLRHYGLMSVREALIHLGRRDGDGRWDARLEEIKAELRALQENR